METFGVVGAESEGCLAAGELCGAGGGVNEDLVAGTVGGEVAGGRACGDDDGQQKVGVALDVVEDPDDGVGGVANEHGGLVVDAGDPQLCCGGAADKCDTLVAGLVELVVEPAGLQGGECGGDGAGVGGDDRNRGGLAGGAGGGGAWLEGAVVGDGVVEAGVADPVEGLEALGDVVGERVGAVGVGVLDADFGGFERIEP